MTLDITKPLQTHDGRPVRFLCLDHLSEWPIIALIMRKDGTEFISRCALDGDSDGPSVQDLVNVPEKRVLDVWLNRYPRYICPFVYASKADADLGAGPNRDACIRIVREYVVGEGMT